MPEEIELIHIEDHLVFSNQVYNPYPVKEEEFKLPLRPEYFRPLQNRN